ncbi:cytotoxic T-lymphocyte protein 4 [Amia ocellicauda]|uniref:cytotoxic T-lymphocyte protein 4 n=1 Tax=Amia ocellicauda TaxID=2972642 RepID=UPI003464BA39
MICKVITLISVCLAGGQAFSVSQPYRVVANNGVIRLRCSFSFKGKGEELRVTLLRGMGEESILCASSFYLPNSTFQTKGSVVCQGEASRDGVELTVSGLLGSDTDLYRCSLEIMYPPPYRRRFGNGTIIYIPEKTECPAAVRQEIGNILYVLPISILAFTTIIVIFILTYRLFSLKYRRTEYVDMAPVLSRKVDCRFGYENFL